MADKDKNKPMPDEEEEKDHQEPDEDDEGMDTEDDQDGDEDDDGPDDDGDKKKDDEDDDMEDKSVEIAPVVDGEAILKALEDASENIIDGHIQRIEESLPEMVKGAFVQILSDEAVLTAFRKGLGMGRFGKRLEDLEKSVKANSEATEMVKGMFTEAARSKPAEVGKPAGGATPISKSTETANVDGDGNVTTESASNLGEATRLVDQAMQKGIAVPEQIAIAIDYERNLNAVQMEQLRNLVK